MARSFLIIEDFMSTLSVLILPGDGIGQECMHQTRRVLDWIARAGRLTTEISEDSVGGTAYDSYGTPLADKTLEKAKKASMILFGAVGGPQWDELPFHLKPEQGLLRLRKELDLFANLRPGKVFDALVDASTLKADVVRGLDILIVRELTGGIYFGQPRGIETLSDGQQRGVNTQVYTTREIERVGRVAFELARQRSSRLCSVEKANVMESGLLWRQVITTLATDYPDVALSHMYADNCAMQLVRNPKQFDVIVTDNLFGDLLSDCAAMLTGSLGMLPSASLGAPDSIGNRAALYEPVHGSAPDIAGQNKANPLATILSLAMGLRYSWGQPALATLIEQAVENTLNEGYRTADIATGKATLCSTSGMGDTILSNLEHVSKKAI